MDTKPLPNVVIVGRPNVGKSALFNRLIGRKISIVHGQPGITRDRLSAICTRAEPNFTCWDTGGIVGSGETELRAQVRRAADEAVRQSDLILFVVDAKEGLSPVDEQLARMVRKAGKPVVLVINKVDTEKHETLVSEFDSLGFAQTISISAEHGRGISDLLGAIESLLHPLEFKNPRLVSHKPGEDRSDIQHSTTIAIVGRPNVGKSSLINSIVRSERAIVSELPGTTRDAIDILFQRDGRSFVFIDTAGIRRRGKHSSSAEVFSVIRAERSIRRADICILTIDLSMGVTAQDKRIAGLIQKARKPAIVVLNKWDLVKPAHREKHVMTRLVHEARSSIFFLDHAPVLIASASTGENVDRLFAFIEKLQRAASKGIGTGVLNRLLRQAFEANPPPLIKGRRLKIFYATQTAGGNASAAEGRSDNPAPLRKAPSSDLIPPEFVLFVNDPNLLNDTYRRYLENCMRKAQPYPGLPINFLLRARPKEKKQKSYHG
jgi:GTP-binding protein